MHLFVLRKRIMTKKKYVFVVFIVLLGCVGIYFLSSKKRDFLDTGDCPFCDRNVVNYQAFYEDDLVLGLYTHKPVLPGHCLIIPKRHVERLEMLSDAEAAQINTLIKKVNFAATRVFGTSSYLILQKNGYEVGQTVPHVHVHYIPRKAKDDSTIKFIAKMLLANVKKPLKPVEMGEAVEKMKAAMQ